jgi:hypothetical protein
MCKKMKNNLKNYVNTIFENKRSLHQRPVKPALNPRLITMILIMAMILVVAILLAAAEGPHYYQITSGI